jgi:hypothetical protein
MNGGFCSVQTGLDHQWSQLCDRRSGRFIDQREIAENPNCESPGAGGTGNLEEIRTRKRFTPGQHYLESAEFSKVVENLKPFLCGQHLPWGNRWRRAEQAIPRAGGGQFEVDDQGNAKDLGALAEPSP